MEYVRLGTTGLKVSRLALGCMSYGDPSVPGAHPWALTEDKAGPFWITGRALREYARREDIVLATKVRVVRAFDSPTTPVIDAVRQLAATRGVSMAQVALAWVLRNPLVSAPSSERPDPTTSNRPRRRSTST